MTKRREQATTESRGALTIMFDSIAGDVADLVRAAGDRFVLPRYGMLADKDIATKTSPTDLVTVADREAEAWLTPRLRNILREMPGRWFPGSIGVLAGGIAEGSQHFLLHASCTPWDHAPVDLLCREAGAHAAMIDGGGRYNAGNRSGIMIAPDAAAWHMLHRHLWEDGRL